MVHVDISRKGEILKKGRKSLGVQVARFRPGDLKHATHEREEDPEKQVIRLRAKVDKRPSEA